MTHDNNHKSLRPIQPLVVAAALWSAWYVQAVNGQTPAEAQRIYQLPNIEVSAFRVPVLLQETTQGVNVMRSEEIDSRNARSAVEVFQQVPGLQVDQLGGPGGLSSVFIRGAEANHALILIDGIRVNDPTNSRGGSYDLSSLDPAEIDKIEVIRGAGSALYGADAIGGVINIITKRGKEGKPRLTGNVGVGGQGYRRLSGNVSGGAGIVRYAVNAAKQKDGRESDGGKLDLATLSGSLDLGISEWFQLGFSGRFNDRDSSAFPEDSGGVRLAEIRDLEKKSAKETGLGGEGNWAFSERMKFKFKLSTFEHKEDTTSPGIAPGARNPVPASNFNSKIDRDTALVSASFLSLPLGSTVTAGYEHMREKGNNTGGIDLTLFGLPGVVQPVDFNSTRTTKSPFVEVQSKPAPGWIVQAGVRRDSITSFGSETSPSVGARYTFPNTATTLKGNFGRGFKPPSFFALGLPKELGGNPDLRPEKSQTLEFGFEQSLLDTAWLSVALFRNKYKDLIDFDSATNQLVNRDNVTARGVETEFNYQVRAGLTTGLTYTFLDTDIAGSDLPLKSRPKHRAGLKVNYDFNEALRFNWNTDYFGRVFDSSVPTGDRYLGGFFRTDVGASYKYRFLRVGFAIDNLFDKAYEQFIGFENPGRRARISLTAEF